MPKDKTQPYLQGERNDYKWTRLAYDLLTAGRLSVSVTGEGEETAVHATGECPRCTHDVRYTHLQKVVLPAHAATLGLDDTLGEGDDERYGYVSVDVSCRCRNEHPGRPATTKYGCGIVFATEVLVRA